MSQLGSNVKFRVARSLRETLRSVMVEAFGAEARSDDRFEIFVLGESRMGAEVVDDDAAPTSLEMKDKGTWLEIVVEDPAAVRATLAKHGIEPFPYVDASHDYVQLPGGQVVRVAGRA